MACEVFAEIISRFFEKFSYFRLLGDVRNDEKNYDGAEYLVNAIEDAGVYFFHALMKYFIDHSNVHCLQH